MTIRIDPVDLDFETLDRERAKLGGAAWQAAASYGIDLLLLERNLALTPQERLRQLEDALRLLGR